MPQAEVRLRLRFDFVDERQYAETLLELLDRSQAATSNGATATVELVGVTRHRTPPPIPETHND